MNVILVAAAICAGAVFGHASSPPANGSCQAQMTAFPLDTGSKCCTHAYKTTTIGVIRNVAEIDQYPWAALIHYDLKKENTKRLCAGTLISGKYVLTGAHCIVGQVLKIGKPTNVLLGEYDLNHEGPDCVPVAAGGTDCTDGAISIEIETIIPHPEYDSRTKIHDIGLIRLKQAAPYTDFIRPICLPATNPETSLPPDHSLHVVSWYQDNIKKLYEVPFVNQEKCKSIYNDSRLGRNIVLGPGHLCAGGLEGMDACKGDGGSPVVYENKDGLAELSGIVSFGPTPCGKKDVPSVYTNVYEYLHWIKTIIVA